MQSLKTRTQKKQNLKMENKLTTYSVNGIPLPTRKTRKQIVISVLIFSWAVIAYIVIWGSPTNSLHESALSWAYSSMVAVVFAYVFGAITDNYNVWKNSSNSKSLTKE